MSYNFIMEKTKFSFIVPVYNTKKEYLKECIDSLTIQNYSNYEIIIVDDGSNKETKDYLNTFLINKKISIIHQENKGIVGARLTGLNHATGDYIYFVDSDDLVNTNLLNILNSIIEKYDSDIIIHESPRFEDNIENITYNTHFMSEGVVSKQEVLEQLLSLHINSVTDKCARRSLYKDIEKHIDSKIINGEDLQQSTYLILNANSFYYSEKPLDYYRYFGDGQEYYDVTKLHEINYLVPTYKMVFSDDKYLNLLPTYKKAAINSIIYTAFQLCGIDKNYKEKVNLLDDLNSQEIVQIIKNIKQKTSFVNEAIFKLIVNRFYLLFILLAKIYNLDSKIDKHR